VYDVNECSMSVKMITNIKNACFKGPQVGPNRKVSNKGPKMSSKAIYYYCVVSKINFIKQCRGSKGSLLSKKQEHEGKVMKKIEKCEKM
jgi:hypothetical protein